MAAEPAANNDDTPSAAVSVPEKSKTEATPSVKTIRLQMMQAARNKDFKEVLSLYEVMLNAELAPNMDIFNLVVEAKGKTEGPQEALEAMRVIVARHAELKPDSSTYTALIAACIESKDKATAKSLYDMLLSGGIRPTRDLFTTLMSVYVISADFEGADGLFKEMREQGITPLSATYLAYIYGCMQGDDADRAYKMLTLMEAEWRFPDARAYENMLGFFGRRRHMDGQLRCIKAIVADETFLSKGAEAEEAAMVKLSPRLQKQVDLSLSSLMRNAQEAKDTELLLELQQLANKTGAVLNSHQEVGVIFTMLQMDQTLQAFQRAVSLMGKDHGLPVKAANWLADQLSTQASMVDDAYYLLETRKSEGEAVPIAAVNIVIEACAVMGDLDRAFATYAELEQLALKPDTGTYNALLHACVRTRELASGRRLLSRMEMDEVRPDAQTFAHRCSMLVMSRQGNSALQVLDECKAANVKPLPKMYVTCANYLLRGRRYEEVRALLDDMRKDDVYVNSKWYEQVEAQMRQ